ncbi:HalX domain-containing protein [Natronobacterium gregoryi]|uniref:HoxA transcriptional regulator n=2 Tax=Natronobacterium gregoryi TaxID=44930 RepID=L0AKT4_NATGS|nr:HalX domain-containing protein [Natronobacterium gregoryi]AFZ74513.1 response regulator with CheY-like receiver, AAA-type ATPase, and DNA-binding domains [Natronobacterium gregoryi SP2]ELY72413.1 response regulator receiver protein [Natronobacterium gregoryi SP2]PLK21741.1 HoxA transcriptional regulator [Natronobacterium gregoryi SP2]SFI97812.1 Response regulator receiver domain-containing protein [Natronobacterium gregoryi]
MTEQKSSPPGEESEVLVVDDEPRLAGLFASWLTAGWSVSTAYSGDEALEKIDESTDIVLLDRRMPGQSGDDVLSTLRSKDDDTRVLMITAVEPDFDIIEMGFDDYLVKPVSKDELLTALTDVLERAAYESSVQEYYALVSKRALLEKEKTEHELGESTVYQELTDRIEEVAAETDQAIANFESHTDFAAAFRDIESGSDEVSGSLPDNPN